MEQNRNPEFRADTAAPTTVGAMHGYTGVGNLVAVNARLASRERATQAVEDARKTNLDPIADISRISGLSREMWERILPEPDVIDGT